jgi:hypothetical protein
MSKAKILEKLKNLDANKSQVEEIVALMDTVYDGTAYRHECPRMYQVEGTLDEKRVAYAVLATDDNSAEQRVKAYGMSNVSLTVQNAPIRIR